MIKKFLSSAVLLLLCVISAAAQVRGRPPKRIDTIRPGLGEERSADQNANLPEEMRIRMDIERADSEYRKTLEDVDKLNDMSSEIAKSYHDKGKLTADEFKKIGMIEKLAKRILSQAGGDEIDDKNKAAQPSLPEAFEQMSTAAANIQKCMKAQTRFVVSATVIASSNEVINLAQFIRHSIKAD